MIFVDTGFLYALVDERDQNHQRVIEVLGQYRNQDLEAVGLTTNHVVEETITLLRKRSHRDRGVAHDIAVEVGQRLYDGVFGRVHHVTPSEERKAFEYFTRHKDKVYSMTDCVSFVIMDAYKITEALAVDVDFTHRFIARPGPPR